MEQVLVDIWYLYFIMFSAVYGIALLILARLHIQHLNQQAAQKNRIITERDSQIKNLNKKLIKEPANPPVGYEMVATSDQEFVRSS